MWHLHWQAADPRRPHPAPSPRPADPQRPRTAGDRRPGRDSSELVTPAETPADVPESVRVRGR